VKLKLFVKFLNEIENTIDGLISETCNNIN